ncbi:MAG TPA: hypothetical protein VHP63_01915, partial [candidate division Zixibacteria bacterium]|nr:hypothetical protein [candidate division Zixibacteria bacterium]
LGVIEVEHLLVYTKKESNSHFFGPTYSLFNKTSALGKRNIPYQTSILQWTGNALSDIIVDLPILERNLGNLAKPIESINDLFRSKLDFGVEDLYSASRQSSFAEILAPTYASLADEIELDNNTLRIKLNVGTKNLFQKTKLSIGIKTGNDTRFTVKGDKLGLKTLGKSLSLTIQNTKFSGRTVLFRRLFGSEIDRVDFDPSFVSSRCFFRNLFDNWDSELKKIEKKFVKIGETLNDSEFERLITGTLILSGFVSAPLGMIFPNSGVSDGICISPGSKEVLIYECTIGSPSIPKIENLGKRLKNVKSQCPDLNFNALLFTFSLTSDLDENQKSFATKADVAVIGIKEIEDLIKKEIKNLMMEDFNSWIVMQKARHIPLSALR